MRLAEAEEDAADAKDHVEKEEEDADDEEEEPEEAGSNDTGRGGGGAGAAAEVPLGPPPLLIQPHATSSRLPHKTFDHI